MPKYANYYHLPLFVCLGFFLSGKFHSKSEGHIFINLYRLSRTLMVAIPWVKEA